MVDVDTGAADLRLAAAIVVQNGLFLTVRKRGTRFLLQPGGKIEPGEVPAMAVRREVREELGVSALGVEFVTTLTAAAANEPGMRVSADVFLVDIGAQVPIASAEIAELVWCDPAGPRTSPPLPFPLAELSVQILETLDAR